MTGRRSEPLSGRLATARARAAALIAFVAIVALTGGGSRSDILSLVVLRPLSVMFAAYAVIAAPRGSFQTVRVPLVLLMSLALLIALQLVPLPPVVWHSLPARDAIARVDELVGMSYLWRPLALSPSGAWNALFSLVVPGAAILLYAALDKPDRAIVLSLWVWVACASAALGVAQVLGNPEGLLYIYAVTNGGVPVGLLANGNHQAVMLAMTIPLAAAWSTWRAHTRSGMIAPGGALIAGFFFVLLLSGSRAGTALAIPGLAIGLAILVQGWTGEKPAPAARPGVGRRLPSHTFALLAVFTAVGVIAAAVAAFSTQGSGFTALLTGSPQEEVRFAALPTMVNMLGTVWATGLGAGSFAKAYRMFESSEALSPYYLNHAHNDWLEFLLEYGLPGAVLLVLTIILVVRAIFYTWRKAGQSRAERLALISPPVMLAAAALFDYPLRVPLIQVLTILWLLALRDGAVGASRRPADRSR